MDGMIVGKNVSNMKAMGGMYMGMGMSMKVSMNINIADICPTVPTTSKTPTTTKTPAPEPVLTTEKTSGTEAEATFIRNRARGAKIQCASN